MNLQFPATRWSIIAAARGGGDEAASRTALNELCRIYWYPLYGFARRRGLNAEDAEDATQAFFATLLESDLLAAADPSLGRLRSFLLKAFSRDLADLRRAESRQKRGAGAEFIPIDTAEAESRFQVEPVIADPEYQFETAWATTVLERSIRQVEAEYSASGRGALFAALRPFLGTDGAELADQNQLANSLNMSPAALRQAVSRLRNRFRVALRLQIADTLRDPSEADIDDEIRGLRAVLAQSPRSPGK